MEILGWLAVMAGGFGLALVGCQAALRHTEALVHATRIPPFVVGITLLAVGTDLPEIANSIVAHLSGHGDLNVGDSVGSAVTQSTLVLGLLPLIAGGFAMDRTRVATIGALSVAALGLSVWVVLDGELSRLDGLLLLVAWGVGSVTIWWRIPAAEPAIRAPLRSKGEHALLALAMLAIVGLGAGLAVQAFANLARLLVVPEYILSFFLASIGTSLPELVVDLSALRRRMHDLAVGDILGSTFVDASLSIGIGPLVMPAAVTASLALRGGLVAMAVIFLVTVLLLVARHHGRLTGLALLAMYAGVYVAVLR